MKYQGSCHCGKVKFEAQGEIKSGLACNCSMCQRKGSLLWFIPKTAFRLLTPDADAASYLFNKHKIVHRFCTTCGIHTHAEATSPTGEPTAAVNLRALEGIDLEAIPVTHFDGRSK
jgi:hypothetical protein